jgi:putative flippase GtrA
MDVDLSTDLDALLPLVAPLVSGHSDLAIGTRLSASARVVRGPRRELISRSYNLLLKTALHNGFSDAQCGFKAMRTEVARTLLPRVEDQDWFFDTELLVLAERNGLRIHEVPVDWVDDPDSRVEIVRTAITDIRGVLRMLRRTAAGDTSLSSRSDTQSGAIDGDSGLVGQLVRFASIGVVSTLLFGALFALLLGPLGAIGADVLALAACALANTAANRRLTFATRGRRGRTRHYATGSLLTVLPLVVTLAVLAALRALGAGTLALIVGLTIASASAALVRFVLLRRSMRT